MATLLRGRRQELHAGIAKALEEQIVPPLGEAASVGEGAALLAYHWLRAEEWEKALDLHAGSGGTGAEALCSSRGDQPLLASPRADGAPAAYARTASRPL